MNFFQLTIFVPLDLRVYDGPSSNWNMQQRLALHTVFGDYNRTALTQLTSGSELITSDILPPAPKPGMFIYKLKGENLTFNGTAGATSGATVIESDVYGEKWRLRVHVVDRIMTPYRFFVL